VLSPMRQERRHRSAENDSFGISPWAAVARCRAMSALPESSVQSIIDRGGRRRPGRPKGSALALFPGRA
jgi:hypothetical protein